MQEEASSIEALNRRIAALEARLSATNQELQDFLYIVSHDLRSPLRAVMSTSMILLEDHSDSLDAEGKQELKRQSEAARQVNRLLEELLKLSRLNRQEISRSKIDLATLVKEVAEEKGISLDSISVEGDLTVEADEPLCRSLIAHLLDNSKKFVRENGSLKVKIGQDGGRFFISDEGIGIEPEAASKIFLPFERVHGDRYPGLGMGLAVVKRIADRHDGSVSAAANEAGGLTIFFSLHE